MTLELGRRFRAQVPFLLVLAVLLLAVLNLWLRPEHWRQGVGLISAAMLMAALLRFVLPRSRLGLLAVRARWFDTSCYLLLGVAILVLAIRLRT